jgi:ATP-dependent DNA ligase
MTYLYGRDNKGKVRVLMFEVVKMNDYYEIHRWSGLLNGKLTPQPLLTILKGKVKRSVKEQTELEFRSLINKKLDKGYKSYEELVKDLVDTSMASPTDYAFIDSLLPKDKTDANGARKLMLAKDVSDKSEDYYDRCDWIISTKLDGVRSGVVRDANKKFHSSSRGGKSYDPAFTKIFQSDKLHKLFDKLGDVIIDGELYMHGRPLAYISGLARLDDYDPDKHDQLEFWIFDYANDTQTAEERTNFLNSIADEFDLAKDRIKIVRHYKLKGYRAMKAYHDAAVEEGYEGLIAREATRLYGFGTRDDRMIKMKDFKDDEFEIIGLKEGLRPEDMVFVCLTHDDKQFEAKPIGPRQLKYQYIKDIESLKGKKLTVKYFYYTEDGIPYLPVGKAIRDYE